MEDEKEKNLEYLKKDLKFMGFGENLHAELEAGVASKQDKFQLKWNGEFKKPDGSTDAVEYRIDFNKSAKTDRYFMNSYTAILKNEADPTQEKTQMFYVNKGQGMTSKEAYNLLEGRAVYKRDQLNRDSVKYNAWVELDFQKKDTAGNFKNHVFHDNYGYNLQEAVGKHTIKELNDATTKKDLLYNLEKGNVTRATLINGDKEEKIFMVANPRYKNVKVFDATMKQISQGTEQKQEGTEQKKEKKESVKPFGDDDGPEKKEKKRTGKRVRV